MNSDDTPAPADKLRADVAAFLDEARAVAPRPGGEPGRLAIVLDATMSRQPTWDLAARIQSEMFEVAEGLGGLEVQLIFFRGFRDCRASGWMREAGALGRAMTTVRCQAGHTQIERCLRRVARESGRRPVQALVYVGDACEEAADHVCEAAGELGLLGVKAFVFQEGDDPGARAVFEEIARLTGGSRHRFDPGAPDVLRALLSAVAAYAAGGRAALEAYAERAGGPALEVARRLAGPGGE
ncbi:MAG: hypothetical protein MI723_06435 [Caulobacterales bacterium]|nr:hypothetical protein [Caulobacterales bacterium]